MGLDVGDTFSVSRTFTVDDVAAFAAVSRDFGAHHIQPADDGRVMVHGLLTATLATQIGGSIDYIARQMVFDFLAPVFSGDTITCVATVDVAEDRETRWRYEISFAFTNQNQTVVATGNSLGIVRNI